MKAPAGSPLVLSVKALHLPLRQLLLQPVQRLLVLLPLAGVGLVGMLRLRLHSLPAAGAGGRREEGEAQSSREPGAEEDTATVAAFSVHVPRSKSQKGHGPAKW